jgi:hypothetical protein
MEKFETLVSGAPLELLKKSGSDPSLCFFLEQKVVELDVFYQKIYGASGVKLFLLFRSAAKHTPPTPPPPTLAASSLWFGFLMNMEGIEWDRPVPTTVKKIGPRVDFTQEMTTK